MRRGEEHSRTEERKEEERGEENRRGVVRKGKRMRGNVSLYAPMVNCILILNTPLTVGGGGVLPNI